jgi:hypothetical protein
VRTLTAVAATLLVLLAGCGQDDQSSSGDDEGRAADALPSAAELETYFDAVASYDPEQLEDAASVAADGSPAAAYAAYLRDYGLSAIAAGQPVSPADAEEKDGAYTACGGTGGPSDCATWADLEGDDGKLTDFAVNDVALDDSLVDLTGQAPITSPRLYTVQPDYAYRSPQSGTLFVLVTITAGDVPLSPKPGIYIEAEVSLNGVATRAPTTIDAGASTPVVLAFPHAEKAGLTGSVTFGLRVGDTPESIGFDLTGP